jgi:hypothetical protein
MMKDYRRVMCMVAELHRMGYGRLRLVPGMSASGCDWRGGVTSTDNVLREHGAMAALDDSSVVARYGTGQGDEYFGWIDARDDSPEDLARKFVARFPEIALCGRGGDPAYERWYSEMLDATAPDGTVIAYADWSFPSDRLQALEASVESVPLPPPGEAKGRSDT